MNMGVSLFCPIMHAQKDLWSSLLPPTEQPPLFSVNTRMCFFTGQLNKNQQIEWSRCQTQWSPISPAQAAMGRMFRPETGAPACVPAAVTVWSVSTIICSHNGESLAPEGYSLLCQRF